VVNSTTRRFKSPNKTFNNTINLDTSTKKRGMTKSPSLSRKQWNKKGKSGRIQENL